VSVRKSLLTIATTTHHHHHRFFNRVSASVDAESLPKKGVGNITAPNFKFSESYILGNLQPYRQVQAILRPEFYVYRAQASRVQPLPSGVPQIQPM
jgi:hypothetical protein